MTSLSCGLLVLLLMQHVLSTRVPPEHPRVQPPVDAQKPVLEINEQTQHWDRDGDNDNARQDSDLDFLLEGVNATEVHGRFKRGSEDGMFSVTHFSPWPAYGISSGPFLTGDFNGDGKTDLLHIITKSNYVHPWLSKGDGTFTVLSFSPWPTYGIAGGPFLTGDFNGDGKTDLVHIITKSNYIHTWLSNGDGTFTVSHFSPWAKYGIEGGPFLTGDFNGDGLMDLVHIITKSNYIHTWLSKGDGTFTVSHFSPWAKYGIEGGPFLTGDFNGDGLMDLVHIITKSNYIHTWLSKGDGTFTVSNYSPWAKYGIAGGPFLATDLNGDGKTDLLHIISKSNYVHPWLSKGDGTFTVTHFSPWPTYGIAGGPFLTADLNGDGSSDLVHVISKSNYIHPWLSKAVTTTPAPTTTTTTTTTTTATPATTTTRPANRIIYITTPTTTPATTTPTTTRVTSYTRIVLVTTPKPRAYHRIDGDTQIKNLQPGGKIDVSAYDCIRVALHDACTFIFAGTAHRDNKAVCVLIFFRHNEHAHVAKEARVNAEISGAETIAQVQGYFLGNARQVVCQNELFQFSVSPE